MHRLRLSIFIAALNLLCLAWPVYGHAVLLSATPGVSQVMKGPDVAVNLRFNARIDARRSRIMLVAPDGHSQVLTIAEKSPADGLVTKAKGLVAGAYILRWQVLANDGHITRGEVHFRVE